MRNLRPLFLTAALLAATSSYALTSAEVAKKFGVSPDAVTVSPKPVFEGKFYTVTDRGGNTVYVSSDLHYAIQGVVIDHVAGKPISTKAARPALPKFSWADLDKANAIRLGTGKQAVIVFADPSCGYCKRLERELATARDELTTYVVPVAILGPESEKAAQRIWCSKDRAEAWSRTLAGEVVAEQQECETPLVANQALMQKYGIGGTPGIVLPSGEIIPGFVSLADLKKRISDK